MAKKSKSCQGIWFKNVNEFKPFSVPVCILTINRRFQNRYKGDLQSKTKQFIQNLLKEWLKLYRAKFHNRALN